MHIVFIEPRFPGNQKQFVKALAEVGATVTAIGEGSKASLDDDLQHWLTHYEEVGNVTDEAAVLGALRFIQSKRAGRPARGHGRGPHPADRQGPRGRRHPRHLGAHRVPVPRQAGDEGGAARRRRAVRPVDRRDDRAPRSTRSPSASASR